MIQFLVKLKSYQDVIDFVNKANSYDDDIDICVGHYMFDAKSILGVTELGLGKVAKIVIHSDDEKIKIGFRNFFE